MMIYRQYSDMRRHSGFGPIQLYYFSDKTKIFMYVSSYDLVCLIHCCLTEEPF